MSAGYRGHTALRGSMSTMSLSWRQSGLVFAADLVAAIVLPVFECLIEIAHLLATSHDVGHHRMEGGVERNTLLTIGIGVRAHRHVIDSVWQHLGLVLLHRGTIPGGTRVVQRIIAVRPEADRHERAVGRAALGECDVAGGGITRPVGALDTDRKSTRLNSSHIPLFR